MNLTKRGIRRYAIFTKFGLGKGVPGPHTRAKFHRCGFKNVPPKSQKNGNIWGKNLPLGTNTGGRQKNLNIGAQLQTSLYALTP